MDKEIIASPFEQMLKIDIVEKKDGFCRLALSHRREVCNPHGIFHGGVIATLADAAAVQALHSVFPPGPYLTVELTVRYKNPSAAPQLIASARTFYLRGKIFKTDVAVTDSENTLVAEAEVKSLLPSWKPPADGNE